MIAVRKYLIILCFTATHYVLFAQGYFIKKFDVKDGLLNNDISRITQDSNGYLWFGGNGFVGKFDGDNITTFKYSGSDNFIGKFIVNSDGDFHFGPSSFNGKGFSKAKYDTLGDLYQVRVKIGDIIDTLEALRDGTEDRFGNLWKFPPKLGGIYRYYNNQNFLIGGKEGINYDSLDLKNWLGFILDNQGYIWIRANYGLYKFTGNKFDYFPYRHDIAKELYKDREGRIWLLSAHRRGKVICINKGNSRVYESPDSTGELSYIMEDSWGNIWFHSEKGLLKFDGNQFELFDEYKNYNIEGADKIGNIILSEYDTSKKSMIIYGFNGAKLNPILYLNDKSSIELFVDRENNIWVSNKNGLYRCSPSTIVSNDLFLATGFHSEHEKIECPLISSAKSAILNILNKGVFEYSDNEIFQLFSGKQSFLASAAVDKYGKVWIVGEKNKLYTEENHLLYPVNSKSLNSFIDRYSPELFLDSTGNLVLYYDKQGIFVQEDGDFIFFNLPKPSDSLHNETSSIYNINQQLVDFSYHAANIFGTFLENKGDYIVRFDKRQHKFRKILSDIDGNTSFIDKYGDYWLFDFNGPHSGKVTVVKNKEKIVYYDTLLKEVIPFHKRCIESDNVIWFASKSGLIRFEVTNPGKYNVTLFNIENGLLSNHIGDYLFDKNGLLWIVTPNGVNIINVPKFRKSRTIDIKSLTNRDGVIDTKDACFFINNKDYVGIISSDAFTKVYLGKNWNNSVPPITKILKVSWKENSLNLNSLKEDNKEIPYDFNPLIIDFIGVSLRDGSKVRYKYFLKGFDKSWQEQTERNVKYSYLPPGNYTFELKACNNDGIWNVEPVEFSFIILPPWYRTWWAYGTYGITAFLLLFGIFRWRTASLRKEKEMLEQTVQERTAEVVKEKEEVQQQKQLVEEQKKVVEEKNKDILDSITYAKRLQDAILPPLSLIKQFLPESFLFYKPKDIVAGDFYWMERTGDNILIAAADCTGHGVPGAMVSVVCSNALNRTVKEFKITEPGKILDKVRELVLETFEKSEDNVQDGMDISLCCINTKTNEAQWSGAYNSLWYIHGGEVVEVPADKQPIGKVDKPLPFNTHNLNLQKGDTLYLFTDGYADQFGGPKGKKFKYKQLQELLLANANESMEEQKSRLEQALNEWKGNLEQVDDILVIGIRV